MNRQQAGPWGPWLFPLLCLILWLIGQPVALAMHSETVQWTVARWPDRAPAGSELVFELVALNQGTSATTCVFPSFLPGRLQTASGDWDVVAEPVQPTTVRPQDLPPGSFAVQRYRLPLPLEARGQTSVRFVSLPLPTLGLLIDPPTPRPVSPPGPWPEWLRDGDPASAGTTLSPERFFKEHLFPHEPFYFIAGTESPNAKFQISFKYRLLNEEGPLAGRLPWLRGLHLAYTQTSLWDWNSVSKPFFDSSYKPEVLWSWNRILPRTETDPWWRLDLQGGFQHESNGKGGADSRSLNIAYLRPTLILGPPDALQLKIQPGVWAYVGGLEENPDLPNYRGYADLRLVLGWPRGLQLSAWGRLGDDANRGSLQLDLTYPMMRLLSGSLSLYLHAQYFTGYGESLLEYQERTEMFRVGLSLFR